MLFFRKWPKNPKIRSSVRLFVKDLCIESMQLLAHGNYFEVPSFCKKKLVNFSKKKKKKTRAPFHARVNVWGLDLSETFRIWPHPHKRDLIRVFENAADSNLGLWGCFWWDANQRLILFVIDFYCCVLYWAKISCRSLSYFKSYVWFGPGKVRKKPAKNSLFLLLLYN